MRRSVPLFLILILLAGCAQAPASPDADEPIVLAYASGYAHQVCEREWMVGHCEYDDERQSITYHDLVLRGVEDPYDRLAKFGKPIKEVTFRNITIMGGQLIALVSDDCVPECHVLIENVTLTNTDREPQRVNYEIYVNVRRMNATVTIDGLHMDGERNGIVVDGVRSLIVKNMTTHGLAGRVHLQNVAHAEFHNITMQNTTDRWSIYTVAGGTIEVHDSAFADNTYGLYYSLLGTGYEHGITITNTTFINNAEGAVFTGFAPLDIESSTFIRNGYGEFRPRSCSFQVICIDGDGATIRNSHFEDNEGYAIGTDDNVVDARNNWWGNSNGPTQQVATDIIGVERPSLTGEAVSGPVLVHPWLTEPPQR